MVVINEREQSTVLKFEGIELVFKATKLVIEMVLGWKSIGAHEAVLNLLGPFTNRFWSQLQRVCFFDRFIFVLLA